MKLDLRHAIDTDLTTFWDRMFFEPDFNREVYVAGLQFPEWTLLSDDDRPNERLRKIKVVPKQDAPAVIKKLAAGTFSYVEEGRFDKATRRYSMRITPSVLSDKIKIEGEILAEPDPQNGKRVYRVTKMTIEVRIFGLGSIVEGFLGKSIEESFVNSVPLANKYIAQHGL